MSIIKSSRPEYKLRLPVSNKQCNYTAFNMRTERTLMLATAGENEDEMTTAVINAVNDNLRTANIKAEELPACELELLLINMRAKAVGEVIKLTVADPDNQHFSHDAEVALDEIKIKKDHKFSDKVRVQEETIIKFHVPTTNDTQDLELEDEGNDFDRQIAILANCVDSIVVEEEVYHAADVGREEIRNFLLDLDAKDFQAITEKFLNRLPYVRTDVKCTRPDGTEFKVEVAGLASFL